MPELTGTPDFRGVFEVASTFGSSAFFESGASCLVVSSLLGAPGVSAPAVDGTSVFVGVSAGIQTGREVFFLLFVSVGSVAEASAGVGVVTGSGAFAFEGDSGAGAVVS